MPGISAVLGCSKKRRVGFQPTYRHIESIEIAIAFFIDLSGVRIELTEGLESHQVLWTGEDGSQPYQPDPTIEQTVMLGHGDRSTHRPILVTAPLRLTPEVEL